MGVSGYDGYEVFMVVSLLPAHYVLPYGFMQDISKSFLSWKKIYSGYDVYNLLLMILVSLGYSSVIEFIDYQWEFKS